MQIYACWVCILLTEIWKIKTNTPHSFILFQRLWLSYTVNQISFSSDNLWAYVEFTHSSGVQVKKKPTLEALGGYNVSQRTQNQN